MTPYILLIVGLALLWLEFYLPGGIFAILSAVFLISAQVSIWTNTESIAAVFIFFIVTCILAIAVVDLALKRIRKSAKNDTFFLSKDQEGYTGAEFSEKMIGKKGVTLTEFGPSGYVLIDGERHAAVCRGPYLDKGVEVQIIAGESAHLIVKPIK